MSIQFRYSPLMRSVWRSVFIWLLVLAMPVQGIAAVGMLHCAPAHERIDRPAMAVHALPQQEHVHATAEAVAAAASETPVLETAHALTAGDAISSVDFKCSACAACCPALGLPNRVPDLPALPGRASLAPLPMVAVPSFVPGGLDRPPRSVLA